MIHPLLFKVLKIKIKAVNVVDIMDCVVPLPTILTSMHTFIAFHVLVVGCVCVLTLLSI